MCLVGFRESSRFRSCSAVLSLVFFTCSLSPPLAAAQSQNISVDERLREVYSLRSQGEFERAVEALNAILEEHSDTEEVLRTVFSELVFTIKNFDEAGAIEKAREALERFPDLQADLRLPSWVNETYDRLRAEMFGRLIVTKPEGCRVFLDGGFLGETPLDEPLVRAGEYELTLTKSGYYDYKEELVVEPGREHSLAFSMNRYRGKGWWLTRVGPAIVAGAILAVTLIGGGDEGGGPEVLSEPPGPPAQ
jgi:hypothetical protein